MKTNLTWRAVVILVTILLCVYGIIGIPKSGADLQNNFSKNIRLGLDLKGGTHLVMQVQVQDAVKAEAEQTAERLKEELKKQSITYGSMDVNEVPAPEDAGKIAVTIKGVPTAQSAAFSKIVNDEYTTYILSGNSEAYTMQLKPTDRLNLMEQAVKGSMETIGNRIDELGLAEKSVQPYGETTNYQILIQLPGVDNPARAKELIGTAAVLGIHEVKGGPYPTREAGIQANGGFVPLGSKFYKLKNRGDGSGEQWYLLNKVPVVTGPDLKNTRPGPGDMGRWETAFNLSQDGGRRFGRFTGDNIGKQLAVLLDETVVSVATIQAKIDDSGRITGLSSEEEAMDLSRYLRSGSLKARVTPLEERSIGPSLGADSIHQGLLAGIAGLSAVVLAMLLYYKRAGVNAVLALILNTVLLLAAVSYFHAVLTLPGIAGIILTIGMAVDSNVLIFERIREELRTGKSVVSAVDAGFSKALWTIIDTHVTTVVSCAFLFKFGEGPVRGFAVTLVIGLIANVFTAVFVSRTIFDWELSGKRQMQELSI